MLPHTVVGLLVAVFGGVRFYKVLKDRYWALHFEVLEDGALSRYFMKGLGKDKRIAGVTVGACIFSVPDYLENRRHIVHETRHVWQQMVAGIFQPVTYGLFYLWLRMKGFDHYSSYRGIPWEKDARIAALEMT